jgi:hypothetical protein
MKLHAQSTRIDLAPRDQRADLPAKLRPLPVARQIERLRWAPQDHNETDASATESPEGEANVDMLECLGGEQASACRPKASARRRRNSRV